MDIVCRKYGCSNNDCSKCSMKSLHVNEKANCTDIAIDKSKAVPDISKDMFEKPPKISSYAHSMNTHISCEALCIHNRKGECWSNGILVNSAKTNAECNSFIKK